MPDIIKTNTITASIIWSLIILYDKKKGIELIQGNCGKIKVIGHVLF